MVVIDRTVTPGSRGVLGMEVESALRGTGTAVNTVIAGLGGRAITRHSIKATLKDAAAGKLRISSSWISTVNSLKISSRARRRPAVPVLQQKRC